jgi:RNA polymerase sigma factor (TIGR02999 family)
MSEAFSNPKSNEPDQALSAGQLMSLVYDELRQLAAARLLGEKPGHTLQATALVHEVYLKLERSGQPNSFRNRGHFFSVAAEAMRQILIDHARRRMTIRHGGRLERQEIPLDALGSFEDPTTTIAVNELLDRLAEKHSRQAQVAKMRLFLQMTYPEIAAALEISVETAENDWAYARAWINRAWQAG